MKSLFAFLTVGFIAQAAPNLGNVSGVVLTSLVDRNAFTFNGGTATNCTQKILTNYISYKCDLSKKAKLSVAGLSFSASRLFVGIQSHKGGTYTRYTYLGQSSERVGSTDLSSKAKVVLWHYAETPERIKGGIHLDDYGVSGSVEAAPKS